MPTLGDIFSCYAESFLKQYAHSLSNEQKKALLDISACRTGNLGTSVYKCKQCGAFHQVNNSCGNRHCPGCQHHKTGKWIEAQLLDLLPVPYFFSTFTLPAELRPAAMAHPRKVYDAMFQASAEALKTLANDGKFIGGKIGFVGILHTWKRNKRHHPHVHHIIPGGGLTEDAFEWIPNKHQYFVNVKALMVIYRAKLLEALVKEDLCTPDLAKKLKKKKWDVYIEHAGNGKNVVKYMANYVYRVAITNNDILDLKDDKVTFKYKKRDTGKYVQETMDAMKFIAMFLLHILPSGYPKIRHYGFMANTQKKESIAKIRQLIDNRKIETEIIEEINDIRVKQEETQLRCPKCNGEIRFCQMTYRSIRDHPLYPIAWEPKNPP